MKTNLLTPSETGIITHCDFVGLRHKRELTDGKNVDEQDKSLNRTEFVQS